MSSHNSLELPTVNISPWTKPHLFSDDDRNNVANEWDLAFSTYGFVLITGHTIDMKLIAGLRQEAVNFFEQHVNVKSLQSFSSNYGHPLGGYTGMGVEAVQRSTYSDDNSRAPADKVESFVFTRRPLHYIGPNGLPLDSFSCADHYFAQMEELVHIMHRISAAALKMENLDFFKPFYLGDASKTTTLASEAPPSFGTLRLAYYPPEIGRIIDSTVKIGDEESSGDVRRYGEHTDYQGFTVLSPDRNDWTVSGSAGLEVKVHTPKGGEIWVPVRTTPHDLGDSHEEGGTGTGVEPTLPLVVNAGDLIQRWTNDRWRSAVHRVSSPDPSLPAPARVSLVFFTGPVDNVSIATLPLPHLGPSRYDPIGSTDHLMQKLHRSNVT